MSRFKDIIGDDPLPWPAARATDPETSHIAAEGNPRVRLNDQRAVLLAHARNPQGLTDHALAALVGRIQTSAGKRRGELRDLGLIERTNERRPTPSGCPAYVWRITPLGLAEARRRAA